MLHPIWDLGSALCSIISGKLHSPPALDQNLGFSIGYNSRYNISYIGIYINYRVFFLKKVIEENSI